VLNEPVNQKITALAGALIDPHQARTIVEPYADEPGFWFGGGNMIAANDGNLYLADCKIGLIHIQLRRNP
jgi:hypothetical protein